MAKQGVKWFDLADGRTDADLRERGCANRERDRVAKGIGHHNA